MGWWSVGGPTLGLGASGKWTGVNKVHVFYGNDEELNRGTWGNYIVQSRTLVANWPFLPEGHHPNPSRVAKSGPRGVYSSTDPYILPYSFCGEIT